jgi:phage repressor protein C with HTH and peptisase S24 domain
MSPFAAAIETRPAQFSIVQAELPGQGMVNLGVLVQDSQSDALHLRFRRDLETLAAEAEDAEDEDLQVLSALAEDLDQKAREMGAEALFEYLEGTLSTSIRITDREPVLVEDFGRAVERLYRKHVQSNVLEFRTHLPRYSLQAAAGKFLENQEVTELGWIETPPDLGLTPDMFVAQIAGHSMEPRIPDGSLCVFRYGVAGSRSGRLVLAEDLGSAGNDRYAVKRYQSAKQADEEAWRHKWIRLESLNPGYPSWDLDPDEDKYRIIAEFVRVLD